MCPFPGSTVTTKSIDGGGEEEEIVERADELERRGREARSVRLGE